MKFLAVLFISLAPFTALAEDISPVSEGGQTHPAADLEKPTEVKLHLGNESNAPDGLLGPYTYGLRARRRFANEWEVEAGYIRLHEPGLPVFDSALDEAQLTLRTSERARFVGGATLWKNRVVDMYTSLAGLEVTRVDRVSLTAGIYLGNADREDERGKFHGAQLAASAGAGPVEFSLGCLFGKIDDGSYRKASFEAAVDLPWRFPSQVSLSVEERYFNFGAGGTKIDTADEYIYIAGLEFSLY